MQAIILAGGQGQRLRPFTLVIPKPLIPVGDYPIVEILIRQLRHHGVDKLTISIGHLGEMVRAYLGAGQRFGLDIDYVLEDKPLGTAGPLSLIENLEDDFLVLNGDLLTDLDFGELMRVHKAHGGPCTIGTYEKKETIELGVLSIADGRITDYVEKPTTNYHVSIGVYAFNKVVLRYVPKGERFDLPNLIKKLLADGVPVVPYTHSGAWLDMGRFDDHAHADETFKADPGRFLPS